VGVHIGENDICHVFLPPGVDECVFAAIRSHKLSTQFVIQNCCSAMKLPEAIVLPNPPASFRRTVTDGGFLQPTLFASAPVDLISAANCFSPLALAIES